MKTKERILQTAIQLFNEAGTGRISTNHIATEAKISPGNLYYHYKNKEEIIRAILYMMYEEWSQLWQLKEPQGISIKQIEEIITDNFRLQWKYRFFYLEFNVIMRNDPTLAEAHKSMEHGRLEEFEMIFQHLGQHGLLTPDLNPEDLRKTLTICWIFSNSWISYLEGSGSKVTEESFRHGAEHILFLLSPYFKI